MNNHDSLRVKYSELDDEALYSLWRNEERLEWAEIILREELISRGHDSSDLDDVAARREAIIRALPPKVSDTIVVYGILGRLVALFICYAAGGILDGLFGSKVAAAGSLSVVVIYLIVLFRRVSLQFKHPAGALASVYMVYQCLEAAVLSLLVLSATWLVFVRNA